MANTYLAYINQTIPVPNVTAVDESPEAIGEGSRTVMGTYRYDALAYKNKYDIKCKYLLPAEYNLIKNHLESILGGITDFWIDSFGGDSTTDSVSARVEIKSAERVQFGKDGIWYNNGVNLELEVTIV